MAGSLGRGEGGAGVPAHPGGRGAGWESARSPCRGAHAAMLAQELRCPLPARAALCRLHPPEHQARRPRGHGATAARSRASPRLQGARSAHGSLTFLLSSARQWQGRPDW